MAKGTVIMSFRDEQLTVANAGVGAGGYVLYTLTLNEWVAIATILYLAAQIGLLIPKYIAIFKSWRHRK